jgi:hypothetical protein
VGIALLSFEVGDALVAPCFLVVAGASAIAGARPDAGKEIFERTWRVSVEGTPDDVLDQVLSIVRAHGHEVRAIHRGAARLTFSLRRWVFMNADLDMEARLEAAGGRVDVAIRPVPSGDPSWERGPVVDLGIPGHAARKLLAELSRQAMETPGGDLASEAPPAGLPH